VILHLISDRRRLAGAETPWTEQRRCLLRQVRFAVEAGVDVVQIRERDLEAGELFSVTEAAVSLAAGSRTKIIVNDRVDVALAARAHGVHLREDSMPPAAVRRLAPSPFVIGRSVHDADAAAALGSGVDYLIAGSVWSTASKLPGHPLLGPEGLARVIQHASVPVVAIGGITVDGARLLAALGAAGVAAIGLFIAAPASSDSDPGCGAAPVHELARRIAAL